ncbi:hypothetical protein Vretimale_5226 [Volvox reticuliferus]|uniref:Uncharacterized protein n=1 Tax=Volvox reticuliferus TaxID=1737510 RepID=A0A8J4C7S0_9CHLO|nr:hypothetical protein Vretifemale_3626 [Volvox reticuliferus]GIM00474.1 hypothetical protein Vretimale_5226 [Volvox reticuliferus]
MATVYSQDILARWNTHRRNHQPWTARRIVRPRSPILSRPDPNLRVRKYSALYVAVGALTPADLDVVLKGPTLSELFSYGQAALSLAGAAWHAAVTPFAIFGTDRWCLNILFYFTVVLMGYNLMFQAPKQ